MAADGFTTIQQTMTVAEGEMFAELFRSEGIEVRFHRLTGAAIGTGEQICELRVDVPLASEARVRELLSELEYVGKTHDEGAADQDAEPATPGVRPRQPRLAAGIAFLVPGGGHFHARRPWTGLVVAAVLVCGWLTSFAFLSWHGSFAGEMLFGGLIALVIADAIGGVRAAKEENRGVHRQRSRQVGRGLALVAFAAAGGATFAAAATTPRWITTRRLARFETTCSATGLLVANGDRDGRAVTVTNLVLRTDTSSAAGGPAYRLGPETRPQLELRAGKVGSIEFSLPDEVRESCVARGCELLFSIAAANLTDARVSALDGDGVCVPAWDRPAEVWPGRIDPAAAE